MDPIPLLASGGNRCERVALVLQGGGALGAYQGGVFQAMDEAGIVPDWLCRRLHRRHQRGDHRRQCAQGPAFTAAGLLGDDHARARPLPAPDGDLPRQWANDTAAFGAVMLGQPGFFTPNLPGPLLSLPGARQATAFYDTSPLRKSLLDFVDFDHLNKRRGALRGRRG